MNPIIDGKQPSWRLWGEEKVPGAIYTVYLKKVRYHPSSSVSFEDADDSISHLEWETVRVRIIKAGTLERLVESLANESGELESTYINVFLSTYRSFSNSQQILTLIIQRFKQLVSDQLELSPEMKELHRKTLVQALMVWLDMQPEDFHEPPNFPNLKQMLKFAKEFLPGSMLELRSKHRLEKFLGEEKSKGKRRGSIFLSSSPEKSCWFERFEDGDSGDFVSYVPIQFLDITEPQFAEQLTWMDAELFKRLIPHHCLGSMWSRRDKPRTSNGSSHFQEGSDVNTVTATVKQFNAVSARVISTILSGLELDHVSRAVLITKWIDIAQELRFLKNFSSLKAITSALQSNAIYRLKRVWLSVPREKVEVFSELARIFSEENNRLNCRTLLFKEGTAKFVEAVGEEDRQLQKLMQRQLLNPSLSSMQGTVPYLGIFLTDLTMIDTAIPDNLPSGLINFDKRRKEFEVLAQIKMLQSSAKNYSFHPDPRFHSWFNNVNILDENESYELSCLIEPPSLSKKPAALHKSRSVENNMGHRKNNSTSSTSSCNSQFYEAVANESASSYQMTQTNGFLDVRTPLMRVNHSMPSLSSALTLPCSLATSTVDVPTAPEFFIIRVSIEQSDQTAQKGLNVYKSIMLSDREHTRAVIQNAMMKHGISGNPDQYSLSQLLPDGEITFQSSDNVYYAINTCYDLNFILRPRSKESTPTMKKSKSSVPLVKRFLSSSPNNSQLDPTRDS